MGTLIIHAGMGKTGTSAIQASLYKNRDVLERHGFRSVEASRSERHTSAKHSLRWKNRRDPEWRRLKQEVRAAAKGDGTLIISNENIWKRSPREVRFLCRLFRGLDIKLLVYVREQVDFLESRALQAIKTDSKRWNLDVRGDAGAAGVEEFLEKFLPDLDFLEMAKRWGRIIGDDNVIARLYSRDSFPNGNVLEDFYEAIGVPADELDMRSESNPSLSVPFAEICNHSEEYLPEGLRRNEILDAALRLSKKLTPVPPRFLSPEKAREIRERFAGSNREFFDRFVDNGTEFPMRDRPSGDAYDLGELAAELKKVIEEWPLLGRKGLGVKRSAGILHHGWSVEKRENGLVARQDSPEASLRFRVPFRMLLRVGSDAYLLRLECGEGSVPRRVRFNGRDLGTVDLAAGIPFESSWLEKFGNAEVEILGAGEDEPVLEFSGLSVVDAEGVSAEGDPE